MPVIISLIILSFITYMSYLIFFWQWKKNCQPFYYKDKPIVIGHRGSPSLITENTIPSFQKAIEQGVDGLEFDIRLSKDNQVVIFHDTTLQRLSNQNDHIAELSLTALQSVILNKKEKQHEKRSSEY